MFEKLLVMLGMLVGTATDIDHREVPDWVNYSMIASGFGIATLHSLNQLSFSPLIKSLLGFIVAGGFGVIMYYSGQWGGGDAKMMMGVGALLGLEFKNPLNSPSLLINFMVLTIFVGAAYGLVWMIFLFLKNKKKVLAKVKQKLSSSNMLKIRKALITLTISSLLAALLITNIYTILLVTIVSISYLCFYTIILVKIIEEVCFVKQISVNKLVEGDWVIKPVYKNNKKLLEIANTGITNEQIKLLKQNNVSKVTVKEGIPFVPSFTIAYMIALLMPINKIFILLPFV